MSTSIAVQTDNDDLVLRLCRRIDTLLDRYLCKSCRYDKNKQSVLALRTWIPDTNCNECRHVFDAADEPDECPDFYSERGLPTKYYFSSAETTEDEDEDETPSG